MFLDSSFAGVSSIIAIFVVECDTSAPRPSPFSLAQVLELGAGTGLAGSAAAALGAAYVLLTDLAYALANLQATVARLSLTPPLRAPDVALLDWNDPTSLPPPTPAWDVVLAADCIWLDHLVPVMITTTASTVCLVDGSLFVYVLVVMLCEFFCLFYFVYIYIHIYI
jgi:hypothetical protein